MSTDSPITPTQLFVSEGSPFTFTPEEDAMATQDEMPPLVEDEDSGESGDEVEQDEDEEESVDENDGVEYDEETGKGSIDLDAKATKDAELIPEEEEDADSSFQPEAEEAEGELDSEACQDHEQCLIDAEVVDAHLCKSLAGLGNQKERIAAIAECICDWYTDKQ